MNKIVFTLNGQQIEVYEGTTILEAARLNGVKIPTLCYLKDTNEIGACRMCIVKVKGTKTHLPACATIATDGMEVLTDCQELFKARKMTLELICSEHRFNCEICPRYSDCELHALMSVYGVDENKLEFRNPAKGLDCDETATHMIRDKSKCVQCRRCVSSCTRIQSVNILGVFGRGFSTQVGPVLPLAQTDCVGCGQCIAACPTGALYEKDDTRQIWRAINSKQKRVVGVVSPAVYAQLGESFFDGVKKNSVGKTAALLRRIGFDLVYDLDETSTELVSFLSRKVKNRLEGDDNLPIISSGCPGWAKCCKNLYPEMANNTLGNSSPALEFGRDHRIEIARQLGVSESDVVIVSISTCTAQKQEAAQSENRGLVDVCITARELAAMARRACVSRFTARQIWQKLPEEEYDNLPDQCGAALSVSGGITEAVLRNISGSTPEFSMNQHGVREATVEVCGKKIKVAAVTGLGNAQNLMKSIKTGKASYDLVEIMACQGGCLNGGGTPRQHASVYNFADIKTAFAQETLMK